MKKKINLCDYIKYVDEDTKSLIKEFVDVEDKELKVERVSGEVKSVLDEEYTSEGYASTRILDFSGDIVIPSGVNLSVFKKNPIIFFNHLQSAFPVGKAIDVNVDDFGVNIKIKYAVEEYDVAKTLYKLVKGGYIKQHSMGFVPLKTLKKGTKAFNEMNTVLKMQYPEYEGNAERIITDALLLEVSVVNIADNQASTIFEVKDINIEELKVLKKIGINIEREEIKREVVLIEEPKIINKEITFIKMLNKENKPVEVDIKLLREASKKGKLIRI